MKSIPRGTLKPDSRSRACACNCSASAGPGAAPAAAKDESAIPALAAGDRVLHDAYGLGTVTDVVGEGRRAVAHVDFGDGAVKKLMLRYAPLEKLDVG